MEIIKKGDKWAWRKQPGLQVTFNTKEEAYKAAGLEMPVETPSLPLPEVREYDTLEEAIAEEE